MYKTESKEKIISFVKQNADRNAFINEIEYMGLATPGPNFYKYDPNITRKNKSFIVNFGKSKIERDIKIKRDNSPSPHTYETIQPLEKFKLLSSKRYSICKARNPRFIDIAVKNKKQIPGVGKYEIAKAWDKSSHTNLLSYKR